MEPEFLIRDEEQSIGRIRRYIQIAPVVYIYRIITEIPIELRILERRKKRNEYLAVVMMELWEKERVKDEVNINIDNKIDEDSEDEYDLGINRRDSI